VVVEKITTFVTKRQVQFMKNDDISANCRKIRGCKLAPASSNLAHPFCGKNSAKALRQHDQSYQGSDEIRMLSIEFSPNHAIARSSSLFAADDLQVFLFRRML
jgi:hypothetical protein